jgi:Fe-S-cluster-containing dehydrogenase component
MSKYAMVVNVSKCVDCRCCTIQCKDEYVWNDYPPFSAGMTYRGDKWIRVEEVERGVYPKAKFSSVPILCVQCDDAPCTKAYPEAIHKRDDGIVIIDPEAAMDEGIVDSCPYGVIYWNEDLDIGQKCTFCVHRLEEGEQPRCVMACPAGALIFGTEEELAPILDDTEPLFPELEYTQPRVYYMGVPKAFVAGNVYDRVDDECLQEVAVSALSLRTGESKTVSTDEFGDFWLENLDQGDLLVLRFQKPGYQYRMRLVYAGQSVNIGDVGMFK